MILYQKFYKFQQFIQTYRLWLWTGSMMSIWHFRKCFSLTIFRSRKIQLQSKTKLKLSFHSWKRISCWVIKMYAWYVSRRDNFETFCKSESFEAVLSIGFGLKTKSRKNKSQNESFQFQSKRIIYWVTLINHYFLLIKREKTKNFEFLFAMKISLSMGGKIIV